jgi:hypothetical protein
MRLSRDWTRLCTGGRSLSSEIFTLGYAFLFLLYVQAIPAAKHPSQDTTIYVIRHAEKPADGSSGLTRKGQLRAQCLSRVSFFTSLSKNERTHIEIDFSVVLQLFSASSEYNIDYIITPDFEGEKYKRAYDTVLPLANQLGIKIDKHWSVWSLST